MRSKLGIFDSSSAMRLIQISHMFLSSDKNSPVPFALHKAAAIRSISLCVMALCFRRRSIMQQQRRQFEDLFPRAKRPCLTRSRRHAAQWTPCGTTSKGVACRQLHRSLCCAAHGITDSLDPRRAAAHQSYRPSNSLILEVGSLINIDHTTSHCFRFR